MGSTCPRDVHRGPLPLPAVPSRTPHHASPRLAPSLHMRLSTSHCECAPHAAPRVKCPLPPLAAQANTTGLECLDSLFSPPSAPVPAAHQLANPFGSAAPAPPPQPRATHPPPQHQQMQQPTGFDPFAMPASCPAMPSPAMLSPQMGVQEAGTMGVSPGVPGVPIGSPYSQPMAQMVRRAQPSSLPSSHPCPAVIPAQEPWPLHPPRHLLPMAAVLEAPV